MEWQFVCRTMTLNPEITNIKDNKNGIQIK